MIQLDITIMIQPGGTNGEKLWTDSLVGSLPGLLEMVDLVDNFREM